MRGTILAGLVALTAGAAQGATVTYDLVGRITNAGFSFWGDAPESYPREAVGYRLGQKVSLMVSYDTETDSFENCVVTFPLDCPRIIDGALTAETGGSFAAVSRIGGEEIRVSIDGNGVGSFSYGIDEVGFYKSFRYDATFAYGYLEPYVAPVPLPAGAALLPAALLGLGLVRRRRMSRDA